MLGFIGLHLIRIEYSGIKKLDLLNKNINTKLSKSIFHILTENDILKNNGQLNNLDDPKLYLM